MIRQRRGGRKSPAILQVEADNTTAQSIYTRLGFVAERSWTQWRRSSTVRTPPPYDYANHPSIYITRRRPGEWRDEYALAQRLRPTALGGMGWLRPLHPSLFRRPLLKRLGDLFSFRSVERLVIHGERGDLRASMWLESAFAASSVQLTLMVAPEFQGEYDEALINLAARRFSLRSAISLEHPTDDLTTTALLQRYNFHAQRTLIHMHTE
jgi:hypothetical protein